MLQFSTLIPLANLYYQPAWSSVGCVILGINNNFTYVLTLIFFILGSVPFLLKEHLSYSQLATFALSSYPYSLKLLWSPVVDSVFFKSFGRRKSWIVPMQLIVGSLMLYISLNVQRLMDNASLIIQAPSESSDNLLYSQQIM